MKDNFLVLTPQMLFVVLAFLIGWVVGIDQYKSTCEPLGMTPHKVEWLECRP